MGSEKEKEWFYMSMGHRRGPVTHDEICSLIAQKEIYLESTQVWRNGMEEWVNLSQAEGFAPLVKKMKEEVAKLDARVVEISASQGAEENVVVRGLSRLAFNIFFYLGWLLPVLVGVALLAEVQVQQWMTAETVEKYVLLVHAPLLLAVLAMCKMCCSRMENVGYSQWQGWGVLVPGYNFWVLYTCLLMPQNFKGGEKVGMSVLVYIFSLLGVAAVLSPSVLPQWTFRDVSPVKVQQQLEAFYKTKTDFKKRLQTRAEEEKREKEREMEDGKKKPSERQGEVSRKRGL